MKTDRPLLLYSDSESSPDMRYLSGLAIPDPFPAIVTPSGEKVALLHPLELARARKESRFDRVVATETIRKKVKPRTKRPPMPMLLAAWLREEGLRQVRVPAEFPLGMAEALRKRKIAVQVSAKAIFPEREQKTENELREIRRANRCSADGLARVREILEATRIGKGRSLRWGKRTLTSEILQEEVAIACLRAGGEAGRIIAAGGDQACDPHCEGRGPLAADQLIIVDIFPRLVSSGYHGDMTRTFLKGRANEAQKKLVQTVRQAQRKALQTVKVGTTGEAVHATVVKYFGEKGYQTSLAGEVPTGFFHGTGHGLGLAVHEAPRVSPGAPALKMSQVITIEPGLYYPGIGGCRIEDVVAVDEKRGKLLSNFPYQWEIS
ncbi:MAG: Xaa-Pro peptidase family protein [Opitutales bacterium]|nr:Xaa-Pro peptidase family protein [Opitutales bacterium]